MQEGREKLRTSKIRFSVPWQDNSLESQAFSVEKRVFTNSLLSSFTTSRNMSGRLDHRLSRRRGLCNKEKPALFPLSGLWGEGQS